MTARRVLLRALLGLLVLLALLAAGVVALNLRGEDPVGDMRAEDFVASPGQVERMGASARERLLAGYTERDVMEGVKALYRGLLGQPQADVVA